MKVPKTKTLATLIPALLAGVVSAGVSAQTPAPATPSTTPPSPTTQAKLEKIEVTGSLIRRVDTETPSAVQIITAEQIKNSGFGSIEELMRAQSSVDASSIQDGAATGFVGGVSTISMRGFGSQGTLILINGRRVAPVAAVDINFGRGSLINVNTIPKEAIERIEILKDGASALYGSDAMAGVVNFVLKKDYQGIEVSASYGANDQGVGATSRASITFGMGDMSTSRFNVFGGVEVSRRDAVMHSELKDRGNLSQLDEYQVLNGTTQRFTPDSSASGYANYYRVPASLAGSTSIGGVTVANTSLFGANYLGTMAGCPPENTVGPGVANRPPGFSATGAAMPNGFCRFNFDNADEAIAKQDRINASVRATYALGNDFTAYADLMYSASKTNEKNIPTTLTTSLVTSANPVAATWPLLNGSFRSQNALILPVGHPDNPTNGTANPQPVQLIYRFTDLPTDDINDLKTYRFTTGIQGTWGAWDLDAALLLSQQDNERIQKCRLRSSLLTAALASGSYRFNGNNTEAGKASVASDAVNTGESKITSLDVRASRELFKMDGGFAAVALGAETRRESLSSVPSDIYTSGDFIGLVANGATGSRDSQALFAELRLPVVKSLEVQTAIRHERYSDFGNSTTGKLGFKFDAIPSMMSLRGTAASGFRAPAISQIGDSFAMSFHSSQDRRVFDSLRCDSSNPNAPVSRGTPSVTRDCNVLGYTSVPAGQASGSLPTVVSANPNLKPETSRSYTFGMILSPTKDIDVSIDWWRFRRDDEIRVQRGIDIMDAYNANPAANANLLIRDPNPQTWLPGIANSGPIVALVRGYGNFKWTETGGMDYDINVRFPTSEYGKFALNFNGTLTRYFDRQILADSPVERLAGTSTADIPKRKGSITLRWDRGNWSSWIRYSEISALDRGATTTTCLAAANAANAYLASRNFCRVGGEETVDIGGSYRGIKNLTIAASLLNLTDNYARSITVPSTFTYWDNGTAGQIGRRFNLNVDYRFK
jgi:iron complex outermembrane recepter protein